MRKNVVKKDEKRKVLTKTTPTLSRYYMAWEIQKGGGGRNPENVVTIVKGRPKWENSRYRGDKGEKQILY